MLYKIFLNIKSDFPDEVFYQIFTEDDSRYRIPLNGLEGWLNAANPMVEIEIEANHSNLQIGFRRRASIFARWIARPVKVDTSKATILTEDAEIIQVDAALLQMGRLSDANFLDNEFMRTAVGGAGNLAGGIIGSLVENSSITGTAEDILSGIPYAGIITALAGVIWPEPSVASLINSSELRMRNLIITQIRQVHLANQQGALGAIRNNIREYQNARGTGRRAWMKTTLASFNLVQGIILNKEHDYAPGSVYLALDLAGLHLGMLRERIAFEKEIFGDDDVNTEFHHKILKERVKEYQDFLAYGCEKEMEERMSQLTISHENSHGFGPRGILGQAMMIRIHVRDNVRRQIHRFSTEGSFNSFTVNVPDAEQIADSQFLVDMYIAQVKNELEGQLKEDIEIPSQMLDWFIPGNENTKPVSMDNVFMVGPVTGLLQRDFNHPRVENIQFSHAEPGTLKYIQLIFRSGGLVANFGYDDGNGGMRYSLGERVERTQLVQFERELEIGIYLNRIESWWFQNTMAMKLSFSDGTDSGRIGHPIGGEYQSAGMKHMGISQDFVGSNNEARKYGFRLMSTFYDLPKTS